MADKANKAGGTKYIERLNNTEYAEQNKRLAAAKSAELQIDQKIAEVKLTIQRLETVELNKIQGQINQAHSEIDAATYKAPFQLDEVMNKWEAARLAEEQAENVKENVTQLQEMLSKLSALKKELF